jgi:hypothetical protein
VLTRRDGAHSKLSSSSRKIVKSSDEKFVLELKFSTWIFLMPWYFVLVQEIGRKELEVWSEAGLVGEETAWRPTCAGA